MAELPEWKKKRFTFVAEGEKYAFNWQKQELAEDWFGVCVKMQTTETGAGEKKCII